MRAKDVVEVRRAREIIRMRFRGEGAEMTLYAAQFR
jgi:hypothetical protein